MNTYQQQLAAQVKTGNDVFIADTARVLGNVELKDQVSVWFGAVLRGDIDSISVGARTNIQESCTVHVDYGKPVTIGEDNIIGHGAIIHGCTIGNSNLIGMGATIMNGATIGNGCVIGANALVTENMIVPDGSMVLGVPGKIVKTLDPEKVKEGVAEGIEEYIMSAKKYLAE
jgi:carbonic anhydrase/acetyltransferase-like protein (isoleucine patch superfamily)